MTHATPTVRLRPMTADELPPFVAATKAECAHDIEVHGGHTHEFGGNDVARNLYRSLGYVETSVQMGKDLA